MGKSVLLSVLCFLLCTSVRGYVEYDYDIGGKQINENTDDVSSWNDTNQLDPIADADDNAIEAIFESMIEDLVDLMYLLSSAMVTDDDYKVSDLDRRIKFGRGLGKLVKPITGLIKPVKSIKWPKKPARPIDISLPDLNVDINTDIVVPPPSGNSDEGNQARFI